MATLAKTRYEVALCRLLNRDLVVRTDTSGPFDLGPMQLSDIIASHIASATPLLVGRLGSTEAQVCSHYHQMHEAKTSSVAQLLFDKLTHNTYLSSAVGALCNASGFFPANPSKELIDRFASEYLGAAANLDIIGSWLTCERELKPHLTNAQTLYIEDLAPFTSTTPWSAHLKGKRVLVVHPFIDTIRTQFAKRELLFANPEVLPEFELIPYRAVQTIAGQPSHYADWFEALESMTQDISCIDFDVAIVGCGAYGLPLSSRIKNMGKVAIHMAGVTQCLFGIKGRRWIDDYGWDKIYFNDSWVFPSESEIPKGAAGVENGCYWG